MRKFLVIVLFVLPLSVVAEDGLFPLRKSPICAMDTMTVNIPARTPSYKPLEDISWTGVPLFLAGIIIKGQKETFRQDYNNPHTNARLVSGFHTKVDDYLQYFGPALTLGLKVGGVKGRSDWVRFLTSAAMTYAFEVAFVNGIKYTSKEQRPDGTSYNSWPSGHTATAFAGATILHKEYGLTRSPWYSVLGYSVATSTAVMRVLNNRHWVSDVFSGAGIGIMSGELGYMLSDVIFKDKRLVRGDAVAYQSLLTNPSFFGVSMGIGLGSHRLDFKDADFLPDMGLKFQMATVVGAEGAYFLTKNVGVGGRLRVSTMPIKGWADLASVDYSGRNDIFQQMLQVDNSLSAADAKMLTSNLIMEQEYSVVSAHLAEFAYDGGLYFNFPLSGRIAIGAKALMGGSTMQSLDISARYTGHQKELMYDATYHHNQLSGLKVQGFSDRLDADGQPVMYDTEWDYLLLSGGTSMKYGTGVSFTFSYKNNFSWRAFVDYDYTRKAFKLTYDPYAFVREAAPEMYGLATLTNYDLSPKTATTTSNMHRWVLGLSCNVSF